MEKLIGQYYYYLQDIYQPQLKSGIVACDLICLPSAFSDGVIFIQSNLLPIFLSQNLAEVAVAITKYTLEYVCVRVCLGLIPHFIINFSIIFLLLPMSFCHEG